ncbi:hypothetical protein [Herbaspirillum sp. SJZ107]|uniref:hypothetical protein n=1 Tax=Herbaspirillum sp. SJZ107 TaxID=2572881 RepID=UPI00114D9972|nr:hypothetical protein [Herbaspirillum sp. SJZ107]TQK03492.1 hypothetical protein FBX97_5062 [Herbaspirillum sp. SJZ107]
MNAPDRMRCEKRVIIARLLDSALQHQWHLLEETLQRGQPPTSENAEAIERVSKLMGLVPKPSSFRRRVDVIVLAILSLSILACTLIRLPSTSVDLDVLVSGVRIDLAGQHTELLIPGELGEMLMLSQVRIAQAEQILPPLVSNEAIVELRQLAVPADKKDGTGSTNTFPVRLQVIAIPANAPVTMTMATAYALNQRGLKLGALSTKPTKAQFGEVIEVEPRNLGASAPRRAIRPIVVSGRALSMDLFPVDPTQLMTVFRDVRVSAIRFENLGESSVHGGQVVVQSGPTPSITVQPSDRIDIRSTAPMLLREVTFDKTGLRVKLTAAEATVITMGGGNPRNLMPTMFDWLRFRWPTQLWGTISAIVAIWFAARQWWRPDQ